MWRHFPSFVFLSVSLLYLNSYSRMNCHSLYSSETTEKVNFTIIINSGCKALTETAIYLSTILEVHTRICTHIYMYVYAIQKLTNRSV